MAASSTRAAPEPPHTSRAKPAGGAATRLTFPPRARSTVSAVGTTTPGGDELVDALAGAFAALGPDERRLVVEAYRLLSGGVPVPVAQLAAAAGWTQEDTARRLDSWPGGAYLDDGGGLVGLWGMAVAPVSPHQLQVAGRDAPVWMWCALDPLFVLPLLGSPPAQVRSTCPPTGQSISVTFDGGNVAVDPAAAVVSVLRPRRPLRRARPGDVLPLRPLLRVAKGGRAVGRRTP